MRRDPDRRALRTVEVTTRDGEARDQEARFRVDELGLGALHPASREIHSAMSAAYRILHSHGGKGERVAEGPALVGVALGRQDGTLFHSRAEGGRSFRELALTARPGKQ